MATPDAALAALPALPRDDAGPVFDEPWEAQAFALALRLFEAGVFAWSEWAEALGAEIAAAQAGGDPDVGDTYYRHWLNALEGLVAKKGVLARADMARRREDWRRAYLNTPHGQPIELAAAFGTEGPEEEG